MPTYNTSNSDTSLPAPPKSHYACLLIGDELIAAHVEDSNLKRIVGALQPLGYHLQEARIVSDEPEVIAKHLTELRNAYSFVLTSGGLGPTHDDRTMQAYALSFSVPRVLNEDVYNHFMKRPRKTQEQLDAATYMSTMPKEVELIALDDAWPLLKLDNCFALPGLPSVCIEALKKLQSILPLCDPIFYGECYVNLWEHQFATYLSKLANKYKNVMLGSYPIDNPRDTNREDKRIIWSKIAFTSENKKDIQNCFDEVQEYMQKQNALIKITEIFP